VTRWTWRTLALGLIVVSALQLSHLPAAAQIQLPDPPGPKVVGGTVKGAVGKVKGVVKGTGDAVKQTVNQVRETAVGVVGAVSGGRDGGNVVGGVVENVRNVVQGPAGGTSATRDPRQTAGGSSGTSEALKDQGRPGNGTPGNKAGNQGQESASEEPPPRIVVQKTNDADGDGTFSPDEVAPRVATATPFHVSILNYGEHAVIVQGITDTFGMTSVQVCGFMVGMRIESGETRLCTFTLDGYTPSPYDTKGNTVEVTVRGNPSGTITATDVSTVTTVPVQVAGQDTGGGAGPSQLASTGVDVVGLLLMSLALGAWGSVALGWGRRRGAHAAVLVGSRASRTLLAAVRPPAPRR
jgi:hypothetical protein